MRYFYQITALLVVPILIVSCAISEKIPSEEREAGTLGDSSLEDLLNSMGRGYSAVRPVFECIEASSDVELRDGDDYTDEEYDLALPKLNGLSEEGRQCAEDYEVKYATQVYTACIANACGDSHPNGCDAIRPYLLNMGVLFDAALACAKDD